MKYRTQQLLAAKGITTAGTEVLDIKVPDIISRLTARIDLVNSSWTPSGHPACAMVNMSLVDGSKVLHSLRGKYTRAVSHYGAKKVPFAYANYTDNGMATAVFPIYFGRRLWDPSLALDPKRFTNLQLKMQHSYLLGGAVPDAAYLEVYADLFDESPPSPIGYLSAQSLWSKTYVASTHDYPTLPMDAPIRFVFVAAASDVEEPDININHVKITESQGKKIIYDVDILDHLQDVEALWQMYEEWVEGRPVTTTDTTFYQSPQKDVIYALAISQDSTSYCNQVWTGGGIRKLYAGSVATIMARASGRCPAGVIPFPMGEPDEIESWWDVNQSKVPQIDITTGPGSTACQYELLVQQLQKYQ
jgi:hypothetical protein